jgi:hypothetical protein
VECVESAYNVIKDRKGKLIDGKFVKEWKSRQQFNIYHQKWWALILPQNKWRTS